MTQSTQSPKKRAAGVTPEKPRRRDHDPHVTNGAEATNLPPDADLPDLTAAHPDEVIERARKDLDEGQVDTDLRATPGLDAQRKKKLSKGGKAG